MENGKPDVYDLVLGLYSSPTEVLHVFINDSLRINLSGLCGRTLQYWHYTNRVRVGDDRIQIRCCKSVLGTREVTYPEVSARYNNTPCGECLTIACRKLRKRLHGGR